MVSVYFMYPTGGIDPRLPAITEQSTSSERNELPMSRYGPLELDNGQENIIVGSPYGQNTIIQVEAHYRKGRGGHRRYTDPQDLLDGVNRYNNVHLWHYDPQEKFNSRNSRSTHKTMKHNAKMRKNHRIQQPGHDVQRFGGK